MVMLTTLELMPEHVVGDFVSERESHATWSIGRL